MARRSDQDYTELGYSERSRYAAHLDRGWHHFERGELDKAAESAQHAEELSDQLPDACMLAAAVASASAELERALHHYERAIERDPEYIAAYLAAGQLLAFDLDRPHEASSLVEGAVEASEALDADRLEVELFLTECAWLEGHAEEARARLEALLELPCVNYLRDACAEPPESDDPDDERAHEAQRAEALVDLFGGPEELELDEGEELEDEELRELSVRAATFALRISRTFIDLEVPDQAVSWARGLIQLAPDEADVWHLLAEAHFRAGETVASVHAGVRALRLDHRDGSPPWAPPAGDLHQLVRELLAACPDPRIRQTVAEQPFIVLIHEAPALELVLEGVDGRSPALSLSAGGRRGGHALTGIAIYRRNVARLCRGPEDFETELRLALFGELANALALDEDARERLGLPPSMNTVGGREPNA